MQSISPGSPRILLIEDDPILGGHVHEHLSRSGFEVSLQRDGKAGLALAREEDFDMVLLDILLPGLGGLDVLARLRERRRVPVILMSALGAEQDRISGFSRGADDYLPKPFSLSELQVRIEAIFRRIAYERAEAPVASEVDTAQLNEERSDICHDGQWAGLTPTEFRLLDTFLRAPDEVLSKAFLYQQVLHRGYSQHDRSLDMHVSNIRRKLARIGYAGIKLESVWGKGYLLKRVGG